MNQLSSEQADQELEKRHRKFERFIFSAGAAFVIMGVGIQTVVPLLDPMLFTMSTMALGSVILAGYIKRVHQKTHKALSFIFYLFVAITIFTIYLQLGIVAMRLNELKAPCEKYRIALLKGPDSEASDAYGALHCPLYSEGYIQSALARLGVNIK